ncbi:MAG: hypothetical protein LBL78_01375 [Prevotellaceae bacterium]|jgi:hypothetical protein|nr:hypothetical protein [Prevotellaceae bacterium]
MKKVIYLLLATLMVASCTKEEIVNDQIPKGKGRLNISLASAVPGTRTGGGDLPTAANEATIQRITIGIFDNATGTVNTIQELLGSSLNGKTAEGIICNAGDNQDIIVVANAPEGHFKGITAQKDFIEKAVTLEQTTMINGYGVDDYQVATSLPMSGMKNVDITIPQTSSDIQTVSLSISRLVARVALESVTMDIEDGCTFRLMSVELRNVATTSDVQPDDTIEPVTGDIKNDNDPIDYAWLKHSDIGAGTDQGTDMNGKELILNKQKYWFYTFANDTTQTHKKDTRLVITGEFFDGVTKSTRYYPVSVNSRNITTTFKDSDKNEIKDGDNAKVGNGVVYRNYSYRISVVIKGKGVTDIEQPVIPANLSVTITPEDWVLDLSQTVTFE